VVVVNLWQMRDFARATGQLVKTDALEARMLGRFGGRVHTGLLPLPTDQELELKALVACSPSTWCGAGAVGARRLETDGSGRSSAQPVLKVFYQRLLQVGKPRKLALIAAVRKLLIILDAILKTRTHGASMPPRKAVKRTFPLPSQRPVDRDGKRVHT
jgi:transposase